VLGRVADYDRAEEVAEAVVRDAPGDGRARLARASARGAFHRFPEALGDLDAAGRHGAEKGVLEAERAAILQAIGCHADALVLRQRAADRRPDITTLGALAVLQAERGEVTVAERLFTEARRRYRGVSPFPVAELDFRRGHMWLREKQRAAACAWFEAAVRGVPAFAPAQGHLAEVEAALGDRDTAIDRLRALAETSEDPMYAAGLARVLGDVGRPLEAERWRVTAATRYDELMSRHPEAFADHAAEFRLTMAVTLGGGSNWPSGTGRTAVPPGNECRTTSSARPRDGTPAREAGEVARRSTGTAPLPHPEGRRWKGSRVAVLTSSSDTATAEEA
jgi:tetratricopeptide (TPR) repeat protein